MKWIKLMVDDSKEEEFIADLVDKFGFAGYYRYMKILKMIGKAMNYCDNEKCEVNLPWTDWQSHLKGKRKNLEPFLIYLESKLRLKLVQTDNKLTINCSMLLKLQDNHQNNLQAKREREKKIKNNLKTLDRPSVDPESDKLKSKQFADKNLLDKKRFLKKLDRLGDQNKLSFTDQEQAFNLGWGSYPVKIGKKVAWIHFAKTVKTKGDYNRIVEAFNYYHEYVNWRVAKGQDLSWQHGNRWFAEWEDWAVKAETDPQNWELKRYKL